jgi:hypothetical protein
MTRLRDERGIALIMALGILTVLTITVIALLTYSNDNLRSVNYGKARVTAYSMAESGIAQALAVLNLPANNALTSTLLPQVTTKADGSACPSPSTSECVTWSGSFTQQTATWLITATGQVPNPRNANPVTKTLTVQVVIRPTLNGPLNNQAWNYIYSANDDGNHSTCDMTIDQSVDVATPLYVRGDLCISNGGLVTQGSHGTSLVVGGQLTLSNANQNFVGATKSGSTLTVNPINEAYIGSGCVLANGALHSPCGSADNVYATTIGTTPPTPISPPTVQWDSWYNAASPGPKFPCVSGISSGTTPVFEDQTTNPTRNDSVPTAWNLTPSTADYDCSTGSGGGEIKWNHTTKVLTVNGTVFIDGSAYIDGAGVISYTGESTLYLSGTFLLKNSTLCAVVNAGGTACDTANWDPNQKTMIVVANGNGDNGLPVGDSVQLVSAYFQGGIYGTNGVDLTTSSNVDGPMLGSPVKLGQSVNTTFPFISFVPAGTPGNPTVFAQPSAPSGFDG